MFGGGMAWRGGGDGFVLVRLGGWWGVGMGMGMGVEIGMGMEGKVCIHVCMYCTVPYVSIHVWRDGGDGVEWGNICLESGRATVGYR